MSQAVGFPNSQQQVAQEIVNAALRNPGGAWNFVRNLFPIKEIAKTMPKNKKSKKKNASSSTSSRKLVQSATSTRVSIRGAGRKGRKSRRRRKASRVPMAVKKYVRQAVDMGRRTTLGPLFDYRQMDSGSFQAAAGAANLSSVVINNRAKLNLIMDAYGKQLNAANAIETINYSAASGHSLKAQIKLTSSLYLRNNSSVDCLVCAYMVVNKHNITDGPEEAIQRGLDDYNLALGTLEDTLMYYPSDSKDFRQNFRILAKTGQIAMAPGSAGTIVGKHNFTYSNDYNQDHDYTYVRNEGVFWLFRIEGGLAHSQAASQNVSTTAADIDYLVRTKYKIRGKGQNGLLSHTELKDNLPTIVTPTQFSTGNPQENQFAV